jgi:hypothetical protein
MNIWTKLVEENPEWSDIIQLGLDKLEEYKGRLNDAHILAMGEIHFILFIFSIFFLNIKYSY